jgi:ESS family glutamate:Na+ symporter
MTSALLQDLIKCSGCIGAFLLLGMFLRAKVPVFQKLLLPASVIGGFIGLLLGPNVLGDFAIFRFSPEWMSTWSLIPGALIVPIFSAVPLGMFMGEEKNKNGSLRERAPKVLMSGAVFGTTFGIQLVIGMGVSLILMKVMPQLNLYRTFGFEMSQGFNGGHGTAGALGNILQENGAEYWEVAQGVATTFATIGLIGGMMLGIFFINRAAKKGRTTLLKEAARLPKTTAMGYNKNTAEQMPLGRETTISSSIETVSVHLALILGVTALAYFLLGKAKAYNIFGFSALPVWFYGLLLMYAVNFILLKLKLDWLIDAKVKSRITGTMSDFAITAAIMSMPLKAVMGYILPIILISALGFIATYFTTIVAYRFFFGNDCPFERAIMSWGVNTGVMINGLMLLKICDPDYETPALNDFSMGFALMSILDIVMSPIMWTLVAKGSTFQNFLYGVFFMALYMSIAFIGKFLYNKQKAAKQVVS